MSYFKPYIDEAGLHRPTYDALLEAMIQQAYRIFGNGLYLGPDSQDYQFIAALAEKIYDAHELLEAVYQSRSPVTAIGAGLDAIVAINGIARKTATKSTAVLTLTGTPGARIENGVVADDDGHLWDLPASVQLSEDGTAQAQCVCRDFGVIYVPPGGISRIMTPMIHWIGATNDMAASVGSVAEGDAQLRARRALSVAQPSLGILDSIRGGIAALQDVVRSCVFENDLPTPSAAGLPPSSICAVVEGGQDEEIARVLYMKKSPGCATHGDTLFEYVDPYGNMHPIRFMRPKYVDIRARITIRRRSGFQEDMLGAVRGRVAGYIGGLEIGAYLVSSILYIIAQGDVNAPTFATEEVLIARDGGEFMSGEIALGFSEAARANVNDIEVVIL